MEEDKRLTEPVRQQVFSIVAGILGVALCSLPFYISIVPPMTDVSQHVLVARIIAEYSNPEFRYLDHFLIEWTPAPTALFYVLLVPLQELVGPFWDARLYLTIWVAATWLAVYYLAKVRGQRDPWIAALTVLPLSFCWYAYNGMLPFLMTLPLFALTVAVWFSDSSTAAKVPSIWALLGLLFGFHIVGAAAAAAVIAVSACAQAFTLRDDRHQLALAGVAVLPLLLLVGLYLFGGNAPSTTIEFTGVFYNLVNVIKYTCATLDNWAAAVMLVWLCLLMVVLVRQWRDLFSATQVWLSAAFLMTLAMVMPSSLGALYPAGPRLFPFVLILLAVSIPWEMLRKPLVIGACLVLLVGLSAFTVRHLVYLDKGLRDFLGAVEVIEPGRSVLPVLADSYDESMWLNPYWALVSTYTVLKGGSNPYVFADPHTKTGASPLKYRLLSDRQYAFLYDSVRPAADYYGVSRSHDYVLLWGAAPEIASVLDREMIRIYSRGKATLFVRSESMRSHGRSKSQRPVSGPHTDSRHK